LTSGQTARNKIQQDDLAEMKDTIKSLTTENSDLRAQLEDVEQGARRKSHANSFDFDEFEAEQLSEIIILGRRSEPAHNHDHDYMDPHDHRGHQHQHPHQHSNLRDCNDSLRQRTTLDVAAAAGPVQLS
jgi:hypothetical protein